MFHHNPIVASLIIILLMLPWMSVPAQTTLPEPWQLCESDELAQYLRPDTDETGEGPIRFEADTAQSSFDEAILEGDVAVERGDQRLEASEVTMDRLNNLLRAEGNVIYGDPQLAVRSNQARVDLDEETGVFRGADYYIASRNAQGSAEQVDISRRELTARLEKVTYSTCQRGREFWEMRTRELKVNQNTGRGSARDITFALKGVPILYFPYLSFPITDERQSGLLVPSFGLDSDNGFDARIPYYWNIAPNRDMTITPRILTNRGVMLGLEYRFLYPRQRGEIDVEYLPDDQEFGDDRSAFYALHQASPIQNLYTDLLYQEVSDDDYLDDFSNNLDLLSPTSLERHFNVFYYGNNWTSLARLQDFQTIDDEVFPTDDSEPYSRLPQLLFKGAWPRRNHGLSYELDAELVYFDHDSKTTGTRLDLQPTISLPLEWSAGYLIPRFSYRYTAYNLDDTGPGIEKSPTRDAPIVSVDSGLFFERPLQWEWWGGFDGIQTLEPRLFYLYVPFRDQSDIPIFDSTLIDRSFNWLFLENRFTGADRLGDANQLTTALTSRLINRRDGRERLRFSIGQIQYFEDREVTLENTDPEENSESELFIETLLQLNPRLSLRGTLQWETDTNDTQRSALDIRYRSRDNRLLNFSYRFAQNELEQVDLAGLWPIDAQWRVVGRWNYSLSQDRNLDAFVGFEYEECCWAFRLLARQRRDSPEDEDPNNSLHVQLELKGLSSAGTRINRLLENAILGYERTRYR